MDLLKNKIESTPDTGAMDYMSALDESEGTFKVVALTKEKIKIIKFKKYFIL